MSASVIETPITKPVPLPPQSHRPIRQTVPAAVATSIPCVASTTPNSEGLVDCWTKLFTANLDVDFPPATNCGAYAGDASLPDRFWGQTSFIRVGNSGNAIWPAINGTDGLVITYTDPANISPPYTNTYPANLNSVLYCAFTNLSEAQNFAVQFSMFLDLHDSGDYLYVAMTINQQDYRGMQYTAGGSVLDWLKRTVYFRDHFPEITSTNTITVFWQFVSNDNDNAGYLGLFLDDLSAWRYDAPPALCGNNEGGIKGVVLPPYDPSVGGIDTTIRSGDTKALHHLTASGVEWVRLGFLQKGGEVDRIAYDKMVNSLCNAGINVLGMVNNETLNRADYDDPNNATDYRAEFTQKVGWLARHYQGRIKYWEVWNEENYTKGKVRESLYAPLLRDTYNTIKQTNPSAQVIFGGLASAWFDSRNYFNDVYTELNNLNNVRPFDIFAIHPYFNADPNYTMDPRVYMYFPTQLGPGDITIIDKFVTVMRDNGVPKPIWVTEIGWNSGAANPGCLANPKRVVTEFEQADYLWSGFAIVLTQVLSGTEKIVKKVIWYQYMDAGADESAVCRSSNPSETARESLQASELRPVNPAAVPWHYGLYDGNKDKAKPAQCVFKAYPQQDNSCYYRVYLPSTMLDWVPPETRIR